MCGIAGIVGLAGLDGPEDVAKRMTDAIAHRGPDAEGVWRDGDHVVLGHRRLSIIDLSAASNQPFHGSDGRYVMVYNGELYNYLDLRKELEASGTVFRTASDTEVMLAAITRWGTAALDRFKGMFAFAVWDRNEKALLIARDRLGIKPLYVFERDGRVLFASEMRALLATGMVPRKLNTEAIGDYVAYQTFHAPATAIAGVRMLLPGHWIRVKDGRTEEVCWWDPVSSADRHAGELPINEVRKGVRERLALAVERRLVSDVPFGAFLSGGIDSTAVVGLMAERSSGPVHTFSVVFDEQEFTEEKYANIVAKRFNTEHTTIRLKPDDLLRMLPDVLAAMDHPSGDGPNTYLVSGATKKEGITMALSGLGGDELFGGYTVFKHMLAYRKHARLASMPATLRRIGASLVTRTRFPADHERMARVMQLGSTEVYQLYPKWRRVAREPVLAGFLASGSLGADAPTRVAHELLHERGGSALPFISQVSIMEMSTYMQNILLRDVDQMSMAHALEVRVPFLDHELVEFVLGVKDEHKYPHTPKELLTTSLSDLLPPEIVHRPKMGFTLPWPMWMRGALRTFCEERINRLGQRAAFNNEALTAHWHAFVAAAPRTNWLQLWHLIVLEDWMERHGIE